MTPPVDLLVHRLAAAFPGRAIIAILPQTSHDSPQRTDGPAGESPAPPVAPAIGTAEDSAPALSVSASRTERPKGRRTLAARAKEVLEREGDVRLSREGWTARLGPGSGRFLERVIRYEAVPATAKGTGKDHRVKLVRASDMVTVLETIEGVKSGKMTPPDWYPGVVRAA